MKDTWCCQCELGPGNNITLIRLSEPQSHAFRDPSASSSLVSRSWDGVRLLLCCTSSLLLIEADGDCESRSHPRKGHLGQVKTSRRPPSVCFVANTLLLRLLCAVVCHLVLCWWNAIVLRNRKRGSDYHELFVTVGTGRRMWVEKEDDWLLSKVICLKNNIGCSYLGLRGNVAVQNCTTFMQWLKHFAIRRRKDAMQLFFTLNWTKI